MTQPPIVPGPYDPQQGWGPQPGPYTLANVLPASKPPSPRWVVPLVVFLVIMVVGLTALLLVPKLWPSSSLRPVAASPGPTQTALRAAYESCGQVGEISDGDRTLFLDLRGNDAGSGDLGETQLICVLTQLHTPDFVVREMDTTRALDGRQSDSWGDFTASWTYHPDHGLDVLIRQVKG